MNVTAAVLCLAAGAVLLFAVPMNRCPCPACGAALYCRFYTCEFVCESCQVAWVTTAHGYNVRDAVRRDPPR